MTTQPHDPTGGALLWSVEGSLTVRREPGGYRIVAVADGEPKAFSAQKDDIEAFLDQLSKLVRGY